MEIELVPEPGGADPGSRAAIAAIAQTGLAADQRSPATTSAWRRAGVLEAVDRDATPHDPVGAIAAPAVVPPPRAR